MTKFFAADFSIYASLPTSTLKTFFPSILYRRCHCGLGNNLFPFGARVRRNRGLDRMPRLRPPRHRRHDQVADQGNDPAEHPTHPGHDKIDTAHWERLQGHAGTGGVLGRQRHRWTLCALRPAQCSL